MVKFNKQTKRVSFDFLDIGDFFVCEEDYLNPKLYMKVDVNTDIANAVDVDTKELRTFCSDDIVLLAQCEIEVNY